jgi:hypothetical protein
MIQRYILAAAFFCIAACATSSPQAPEPRVDTAKTAEPVASSSSTVAEDQFEVVAVPEVPQWANTTPPPEVTCRRETEIGSRRVKRICRTQSESDQVKDAAEDTLERLRHMKDVQNPGVDL